MVAIIRVDNHSRIRQFNFIKDPEDKKGYGGTYLPSNLWSYDYSSRM